MEHIITLSTEAADQGKYMIIGGDFNLTHDWGDREVAMQNLCNQFQFHILNGSGRADENDNWTFRTRLGNLKRIDYILASAGIECRSAYASNELDLGSEHRSIKARIQF